MIENTRPARRPWNLPCLHLIAASALIGLIGCGDPGPANVILISIDTLRADHLSSYGYPKKTSPNIDRIAAEGALFETVIAESSWTLPTHMSMMTGLTSNVHQVQHDAFRLDSKRTTLAEVLQDAGYETAGYYSAPYLHPMFGFDAGFDIYESVVDFDAYNDPGFSLTKMTEEQRRKLGEQDSGSHRTITTPDVVDRALAYLDQNHDDRFFLFLHLFDVHSDYIPPEEDWRPFDPNYEGNFTGDGFWFNSAFRRGMNQSDFEHVLALYDGEIHFVDRYLQKIFARLEKLGIDDETLIVITSDHGEEFLEHGGKAHRYTLFDEVLKVPLIFRWKGRIDAKQRFQAQVRQIEIMPTILSLLGLERPRDVMGADLSPSLLKGKEPEYLPAMSRLIWPGSHYGASMRTGDAKYLSFKFEPKPNTRPPQPAQETTTDERVLRAYEEFERYQTRELDLRSKLEVSGENLVDMTPAMLLHLIKLGYVQGTEGEPTTGIDLPERRWLHDLQNDPKEQRPFRDGRAPK